jgi:hypothetical protein
MYFIFYGPKEKNPVNVDPLKYNLKDPIERQTLAQLLNQGLNDPIGYCIAIAMESLE